MISKHSGIFLILLILSLISCNKNKFFQKVYTFDDYSWNIDEKITFNPEISKENTGLQYELTINIRYITGFSYKYLNLMLILTRPDGSGSTKEISIQMVTDDKKYRGSGMGDIWDLDYEVSEPIIFPIAGNYEIELKPMMGDLPVNFINELGICLIKIQDSR